VQAVSALFEIDPASGSGSLTVRLQTLTQVLYIVTRYSKCTRALMFQNYLC
jgi:hypothetical protein